MISFSQQKNNMKWFSLQVSWKAIFAGCKINGCRICCIYFTHHSNEEIIMRVLSKKEMKAVSAGQCYDSAGNGSYSCGTYVPPAPYVPPYVPPKQPVCTQYAWVAPNYGNAGYYTCVKWQY